MEFQEAVGAAIANEDKIIYKDSPPSPQADR